MFFNIEKGPQGRFLRGPSRSVDKVVCNILCLMKWSVEIKDLITAYMHAGSWMLYSFLFDLVLINLFGIRW